MTAPNVVLNSRPPARVRWSRVILLAVALAAAGLAAEWLWRVGTARRVAPEPASMVFVNPRVVQELRRMAREQPRDPEWPLRLGLALLEERHFLSAREALREALAKGAREETVRAALGACARNLEQPHAALAEWQALARLQPRNLRFALEQVQELTWLERKADAAAELDRIAARVDAGEYSEPERAAQEEAVAAAYLGLGNARRCLEYAERARRAAPTRTSPPALAAQAQLKLGDPAEALVSVRRALLLRPDDPELVQLLLQALGRQPGGSAEPERYRLLSKLRAAGTATGDNLFALAEMEERRGRWEEAARAYVDAEQKQTQPLEALRRAYPLFLKAGLREDGIYTRGRYLQNQGRHREAIAAYRELTRMHQRCPSGYMHIARAYLALGDWRSALQNLDRARAGGGYATSLFAVYAEAYKAARDRAREQQAWERFIREDPENADIGHSHLASLAANSGLWEEAERHYRKSVELQPTADLYRVRFAELLLQKRSDPARLAEAVGHLEEAVRLARANSASHYALGVAYRYAGRVEEAIWALRHAVDLNPGEGQPYMPLGQLLTQSGRKEEGAEMLALARRYNEFQQAYETLKVRVDRSPRDVQARRQLARFYERAGAWLNASREYEQILLLAPSDQAARRRLQALNREHGLAPSARWDPQGS
jgi:tetratricopeptide (TPR) repeat protein